jgi:hypothetical protein
MGHKRCMKEDYQKPENPKYICMDCDRLSKKKDQLCEPKKVKSKS